MYTLIVIICLCYAAYVIYDIFKMSPEWKQAWSLRNFRKGTKERFNSVHEFFRMRKRLKELKEAGLDIDTSRMRRTASLSEEEEKLLESDELPDDPDIERYYKMYCKKWEFDNSDNWTTGPQPYDEYYKRARTRTKIVKIDEEMGLMTVGGWKFIIGSTCDAFVGMAPHQTYMRFRDYERMVAEDEAA